ncbi:hypothetical protein L198_00570 [Cryptococcus wingfieldii CBS 7118]|uniref:Peroxin/Ferlin domain-containing protein n=1 Tax=Cryptococcus wingfieldii CBS 7118 TaxID=1295528 RepID=A0A1E3K8J0_9TREE|nr:hypothetical protein L198_00570 [Cryptococcus wingfieldii CBS 7118]ODO08837.1 hypothetical protein L198_00570 [Cryptococcus wingfieldii CBS 7118]
MPPPPLPSPTTQLQSHDLVASLPAPYLRLLVLFARPIKATRHALEVLLWTPRRRVESWMVVAAWWALCLGSQPAFRYMLPPLLFLPLIPLTTLRLTQGGKKLPDNTPSSPSTPDTLLLTLADINAVYALMPASPLPATSDIYARFRQLGVVRLVRGLAVIWGTWLVLGQFVFGYRTLLALLGTIALLLPSPPLAHLITLLSNSLLVRQLLALAFLFTFGSPPETSYRFKLNFSLWGWLKSKWAASRRPSSTFSFRKPAEKSSIHVGKKEDHEDDSVKVEDPIYFRFEIHENQRWWMGLDWTSALLPQERPSWCDSHVLPVSPPSSFTLPAPVSIVINTATMTDRYARIRRSAEWKWLDDDWSIVRAGPGLSNVEHKAPSAPISRDLDAEADDAVAQPPAQIARPSSFISGFGTSPTAQSDDAPFSPTRAQSMAEQAFAKGLEKLKGRAVSSGTPGAAVNSSPRKSGELLRDRTGSHDSAIQDDAASITAPTVAGGAGNLPTETVPETDTATDNDGWVYGDNKWESVGPKGGLGKFTRRRRWQRRAVCIETIRILKPTDEPAIVIPSPGPESEVATPTAHTPVPSSPLKSKPVVAVSAAPKAEDAGATSSKSHVDNGSASSTANISRDEVLRQRLKKAMGNAGA